MSVTSRVSGIPALIRLPRCTMPAQLNESLLEPLFLNLLKLRTTMEDGNFLRQVYLLVLSGIKPFDVWHNLLGRNKMVVMVREKICVYLEGNLVFNFMVSQYTTKCFYSMKHLSMKTKHLILFQIVQPFFDYLYNKPMKSRSSLRSVQWMNLDAVPLKSLMMSLRTVRSLMTDINTILSCNFPSNRTPQIKMLAVNCISMDQVKTMLSKVHCHSEFLHLNFPTFNWDELREFFDKNNDVFLRVHKLTISGEISRMHEYFVEFMTSIVKMFPKLRYLNFHFRIYNRSVQPLPEYNVEYVINELNALALMVKHVAPECNMTFKLHRFDLFSLPDRRRILENVNRIENVIRYTTLFPIQNERCFRMRSSMVVEPQLNDFGELIRGKKLFYMVSLFEENPDFPSNIANLYDDFEYVMDRDPPVDAKKRKSRSITQ
uniref:F-box domain-containing protein n=1 Tax=Panagrellus redivivus TaxID=6233 RepID=A0A7E4ZUR7_PANRE